MAKTIYFIRHGETEYNKLGIVQGSGVDSELNENGRAQAQAFYNHSFWVAKNTSDPCTFCRKHSINS